MSDQNDKTCATCRFRAITTWQDRREGRPECRRHPPKVFHVELDELVVLGAFPPIRAEDLEWCGEWEGIPQS